MNQVILAVALSVGWAAFCDGGGAVATGVRAPQRVLYRSFLKETAATRRFADGGIELRCFTVGNTFNSAGNPYCEYPVVWKKGKGMDDGAYDWETVDREFQDLVDASPKAKFIVLVDLNTPPWLIRRLRYDSFSTVSVAATDPYWRRITGAWLKAFLAHAEEKWGGRTVGYVLGAGNCTEWTELDYRDDGAARVYSLPSQDASWREWCRTKGVDHGRFTPRGEELDEAAFDGTFYDPRTEGAKIDFWKFRNESVASALLEFAHLAKGVAPRKEIGAFFGYYLLCNPNIFVSWNHLDYERVYDSPDIDFVITPANYTGRACGGGTGTLLIQGSLAVRGKRLLHEIDLWSHGVIPKNQTFCATYFRTEADDLAGNTREAASAIVTHASMWWFDMWGGFYDGKALFDRIVRLNEITRRFADDASPSLSDVLFVADPQSCYYVNEKSRKLTPFPWSVRDQLAKTGFACDYYSFGDLGRIDLGKYRAVVFPGQFLITPERAKFLREKVCTDGRTVVWFFAPGITDGTTLDPKRIREWTGADYGAKEVVTRDFGSWKSVFVPDYEAATCDTSRFMRILRTAGAHAWTDDSSVVYANERLFSVHVKDGGVRTVHLPAKARKVTELISGRVVATDARDFAYGFEGPDTRIFLMER